MKFLHIVELFSTGPVPVVPVAKIKYGPAVWSVCVANIRYVWSGCEWWTPSIRSGANAFCLPNLPLTCCCRCKDFNIIYILLLSIRKINLHLWSIFEVIEKLICISYFEVLEKYNFYILLWSRIRIKSSSGLVPELSKWAEQRSLPSSFRNSEKFKKLVNVQTVFQINLLLTKN